MKNIVRPWELMLMTEKTYKYNLEPMAKKFIIFLMANFLIEIW